MPGWYPTKRSVANGDFIQRQVRLLRNQNLTIDLAYADLSIHNLKKSQYTRVESTLITKNGSDYIVTGPFWPRNIPVFNQLYIKHFAEFILKKYDKSRPAIIHAHTFLGGAVGIKLKEKWNCPLVITEHFTGIAAGTMPPSDMRIAKKAYRQADQLVAVSDSLSEAMNSIRESDIIVMPNFIDSSVFNIDNSKPLPFHIVSIGELIPRKNIEILILAFKEILEIFPTSTLTIVGDGQLKTHLQSVAESLSISNHVTFTGRIGEDKVSHILNSADVLAHPSSLETFGIVIIEALASGVPVICFDSTPASEHINYSNGTAIKDKSTESFRSAIIEYFNNRDNYNRNIISIDAVKKFSEVAATKELVKLYSSLL